jgi:hypothetical protein
VFLIPCSKGSESMFVNEPELDHAVETTDSAGEGVRDREEPEADGEFSEKRI